MLVRFVLLSLVAAVVGHAPAGLHAGRAARDPGPAGPACAQLRFGGGRSFWRTLGILLLIAILS